MSRPATTVVEALLDYTPHNRPALADVHLSNKSIVVPDPQSALTLNLLRNVGFPGPHSIVPIIYAPLP
jgi:hypothetical protein